MFKGDEPLNTLMTGNCIFRFRPINIPRMRVTGADLYIFDLNRRFQVQYNLYMQGTLS